MGLDIVAISHVEITEDHKYDWQTCGDAGHEPAYIVDPSFSRSLRGLEENRCYVQTLQSDSLGFRAGSYGGYGMFREDLAVLAGTSTEAIWAEENQEAPFFELINFADNEGTIGSEAAKDLAEDFANFQDKINPRDDRFREAYFNWTRACNLAAQDGMIIFG